MNPDPPAAPAARRGSSRILLWLSGLFAALGVAPIVIAWSAGAIAEAHGCALDEGFVHPCTVAGREVGKLLYSMGVTGWLALLTIWLIPVALALLIAGLVGRANERRAA